MRSAGSRTRNQHILDLTAANLAANDLEMTPGCRPEKVSSCDKMWMFWVKGHNYCKVYAVFDANLPFCNR